MYIDGYHDSSGSNSMISSISNSISRCACSSLSSLFPHLNYDSRGQMYPLIHVSVKGTVAGHQTQSCDDEHTSVCLSVVLAAQWSGVSIWLDRQRADGGGVGRAGQKHSPPSCVLTNPSLPAHSHPRRHSCNYSTAAARTQVLVN